MEEMELKNNDLPTFPLESFPDWIQNYCKDLANAQQVPADMVVMILLSCFSTASMKKIVIKITETWMQDTNLYTLTLAPSGSNKSGVMTELKKPIFDFESNYNKKNAQLLKETISKRRINEAKRQNLIKELAKQVNDSRQEQQLQASLNLVDRELSEPEPTPLRLLCDDATVEKIAFLMRHNENKIAIIEPEGIGLFQTIQGRYSGASNLDLVLKSDEDSSYQVDRMNNEREDFKLNKPRMTIGIACQPHILANLKSEIHDTGLFARFLISNCSNRFTKRKLSRTARPNTQLQNQYEEAITSLLNQTEEVILTFSDEAFKAFNLMYDRIEEEKFEGALAGEKGQAFGGKLAGRIARIIALVHIMEQTNTTEIPTTTVERCKPLIDYFISHKLAFHGIVEMSEMEREQENLLERLEKFAKGESVVSGSSFQQHVKRDYKAKKLKALLSQMNEAEKIRFIPLSNGAYNIGFIGKMRT